MKEVWSFQVFLLVCNDYHMGLLGDLLFLGKTSPTLYFCIKFYAADPCKLFQEVTRYVMPLVYVFTDIFHLIVSFATLWTNFLCHCLFLPWLQSYNIDTCILNCFVCATVCRSGMRVNCMCRVVSVFVQLGVA